jgi:hypothetical protein
MPKTKLTRIIEEGAQKPNTQALLDKTRKHNEEVKRANIRSGAAYGPGSRYYTDPWQNSMFGEGAPEELKSNAGASQTMPDTDHDYRGFRFAKDKGEPHQWSIKPQDGLALPKELSGKWTDVPSMEKAVDTYISRVATKTD